MTNNIQLQNKMISWSDYLTLPGHDHTWDKGTNNISNTELLQACEDSSDFRAKVPVINLESAGVVPTSGHYLHDYFFRGTW